MVLYPVIYTHLTIGVKKFKKLSAMKVNLQRWRVDRTTLLKEWFSNTFLSHSHPKSWRHRLKNCLQVFIQYWFFGEFVLHFCSYLIIILIFVSSTNHVRHGLWDRCGWNCSESKDGSFQLLHAINTPVDAAFHFNGKKIEFKTLHMLLLMPNMM